VIKEKVSIFFRRVSEATPACLLVMVHGDLSAITWAHWETALRTGAITGAVLVLVSFVENKEWLHNRYVTGALTGIATTVSDFIVHPGAISGEALITGAAAAVLCVLYSFIVKDK
jgi:hypothetical protein